MRQLVTQAEFSRMQGVDKAHISRLKAAGRLVMEGDKVDVAASRARIAATADLRYTTKAAQNAPQGDAGEALWKPPQGSTEQAAMSLQASRAVKENYLARMAQLTYERESGKLVDTDEVRLYAADLGATFRAALETMPDRLAPELVPLIDADAIRAVLVEHFEQVMQDLSTRIEKGINRANIS